MPTATPSNPSAGDPVSTGGSTGGGSDLASRISGDPISVTDGVIDPDTGRTVGGSGSQYSGDPIPVQDGVIDPDTGRTVDPDRPTAAEIAENRLEDVQVREATARLGVSDPALREGIEARTEVRETAGGDLQVESVALDTEPRQARPQPDVDVTAQSADVALGLAASRPEQLEAGARAQVQRQFDADLQPGRDFTVDAGRVSEAEARAINRAGAALGATPGLEPGRQVDVDLTEQGQRRIARERGADLVGGVADVGRETLDTLATGEAPDLAVPDVGGREVGSVTRERAGDPLADQPGAGAAVGAVAAAPELLPGDGGGRPGGLEARQAVAPEPGIGPDESAIAAIEETSADLQRQAQAEIVEPVAEVGGDIEDLHTQTFGLYPAAATGGLRGQAEDVETAARDLARPPSEEIGEPTLPERGVEGLTTGLGLGATAIVPGGPATAIGIGRLGVGAGQFTAEAIETEGPVEGTATAGAAAVGFGATVADQTVERARNRPFVFAGELGASFVGGAALSPVRLTRASIPVRSTRRVDLDVETQRVAEGVAPEAPTVTARVADVADGTTTVRGLRVTTPPAAEVFGLRGRGRTIAGARGARPTLGAPSVDLGDVDFRRLGTADDAGATFDPRTPFETEVLGSSIRASAGEEAAARFETRVDLQRQLGSASLPRSVSAEDVVRGARDVPDEATDEILRALDDIDATIKGSAASAQQADSFRQPRDLDLAVSDEGAARARLGEALEGTGRSVGEVFDLTENPAFNNPRQFVSGGERLQRPIISEEGIRVNPITEEGIRKAQGGATVRGPEAPPGGGVSGIEGVDVGPKPTGPDPSDLTRQKDIVDLSAIGRSVARQERERLGGLNPFARRRARRLESTVEEFEELFAPEMRAASEPVQDIPLAADRGGLFGGVGGRLAVGEFIEDARGQAGLGAGFRGGVDDVRARGTVADDLDEGAGRGPRRGDLDDVRARGTVADDLDEGAGRGPRRGDLDSPAPGAVPETSLGSPAALPGSAGAPAGAPRPSSGIGGVEDPGLSGSTPGVSADVSRSPAPLFGGSPASAPIPSSPPSEPGAPAPSPGSPPASPGGSAGGPGESPSFFGSPVSPGSPPSSPGGGTAPPESPFVPFGVPGEAPRRPRRDDNQLTEPDREPLPAVEPLPQTPEFVNPILSLFGERDPFGGGR